ncbi:MipA/OmpV family protein [Roseomonas chloroacetimidivorans]|uniref:MipA/OmpV family protein n=1 Tax=Roseomonas chloroacetimidivorans TaxID=1766656 RepID=UPI003C733AA1
MRRLLLAMLLLSAPAVAQEVRLPVFEAGVAGGGGWLPDYPAADQNHFRGIAVPYLIYRGEVLRADDQGVRGRVLRGERIGLDLSFSGAFPSSSDDNRARRGMPDLDWQGEVGPALRLTFWRDPTHPRRINLELPVRAVFSSDLTSVHYRGFVFSPELAFEDRNTGLPGARLRVGVGPIFATERLHRYFYEVAPQYALPDRPAYRAKGGYLGSRLQFSYRVPITEQISFVGGGRVENFASAANEESPLHRQNWNATVALGFAWSFWRSEATVLSSADPFD